MKSLSVFHETFDLLYSDLNSGADLQLLLPDGNSQSTAKCQYCVHVLC